MHGDGRRHDETMTGPIGSSGTGPCWAANVVRRFDRVGDLFAGVLSKPQELGLAIEKLSGVMG